jgi:hypothetical protein
VDSTEPLEIADIFLSRESGMEVPPMRVLYLFDEKREKREGKGLRD